MFAQTSQNRDSLLASDKKADCLNLHILGQLNSRSDIERISIGKSMGEMLKGIQDRNARFNYTQSELNQTNNELATRGVDIDKVLCQVDVRKREKLHEDEMKRDVEECNFYLPSVDISNVDDYMAKLDQYHLINSIQITMIEANSSAESMKKFFRKATYNDVNQNTEIAPNVLTPSEMRDTSNRLESTQRTYAKAVADYVAGACRQRPIQLARIFSNINSHPVWAVLVRQLESADLDENNNFLTLINKLLKSSIRLIEEEYAETLPKEQYGVQNYTKSIILSSPELRNCRIYSDPRTNQPVWAIVFNLLRAGRTVDIIKYKFQGSQKLFLEDFKQFLQGDNCSKFVWRGDRNDGDIFLVSIYNLMNREATSDESIVSQSRDFLWFALRTMNIEDDREYSLNQLRGDMISAHRVQNSIPSVLNLIYCTAYEELLSRQNDKLSLDDKLHMRIILQKMGIIDKLMNYKRQEYISQLLKYAEDMLPLGLDNAINYLLLLYNPKNPESVKEFYEALQRIIVQRNQAQEFYGTYPRLDTRYQQQIRKIITNPNSAVEKLLAQNVAQQYKRKNGKFVFPAMLLNNIAGLHKQSLDFLIEMKLIELTGEKQLDEAEKKDLWKIMEKLIKENKPTKDQQTLIRFMRSYQSLGTTLQNRSQVSSQLLSNRFIPRDGSINEDTQRVIASLNSRGSLRLYLMFFEMVINAVQVECRYKDDKQQYRAKMTNLLNYMSSLKKHSLLVDNTQSLKSAMSKIEVLLNSPMIV